MQTNHAAAEATAGRALTIQLPDDVSPGLHKVVVVLNPKPAGSLLFSDWPPNDAELVDPSNTFRRDDLYGDDGS